jgi:hypothetical protein
MCAVRPSRSPSGRWGVMDWRRSPLSVPLLTSINDHVTTADALATDLGVMHGSNSKHAPKQRVLLVSPALLQSRTTALQTG